MLEQNHAELDRKGVSNIVISISLILIVTSISIILWSLTNNVINKSPLDESCLDFIGISIEEACYLNSDEIKIALEKRDSKVNIKKISFSFLPSDSLWEITGKKCLDARLEDRKYGSYCDIIDHRARYVFDTSDLEVQNTIAVSVSGNYINCFIGEKEIKSTCE